ncbi:hypothetical protein HKX48_001497 [Thoreauomyces humboldtii]|nr:hypothetical protein HKX48_001497 [Thoreauomyces humboldtii]
MGSPSKPQAPTVNAAQPTKDPPPYKAATKASSAPPFVCPLINVPFPLAYNYGDYGTSRLEAQLNHDPHLLHAYVHSLATSVPDFGVRATSNVVGARRQVSHSLVKHLRSDGEWVETVPAGRFDCVRRGTATPTLGDPSKPDWEPGTCGVLMWAEAYVNDPHPAKSFRVTWHLTGFDVSAFKDHFDSQHVRDIIDRPIHLVGAVAEEGFWELKPQLAAKPSDSSFKWLFRKGTASLSLTRRYAVVDIFWHFSLPATTLDPGTSTSTRKRFATVCEAAITKDLQGRLEKKHEYSKGWRTYFF